MHDVLQNYSQVLDAQTPEVVPKLPLQHAIDLINDEPINCGSRRLPYSQREDIGPKVKDLLNQGVVSANQSIYEVAVATDDGKVSNHWYPRDRLKLVPKGIYLDKIAGEYHNPGEEAAVKESSSDCESDSDDEINRGVAVPPENLRLNPAPPLRYGEYVTHFLKIIHMAQLPSLV